MTVKIKSTRFRDKVTDKDGNEFQVINHEFYYPHTNKLTKSQLKTIFPNHYEFLTVEG